MKEKKELDKVIAKMAEQIKSMKGGKTVKIPPMKKAKPAR